jgi:hypothetical protein
MGTWIGVSLKMLSLDKGIRFNSVPPIRRIPPLKHKCYARAMTVCIAALAKQRCRSVVVLCCDWQVGHDCASWEAPVKFEDCLADGLTALCAGTLEHARDYLRECKRALRQETSLTSLKLKEILRSTFQLLLGSLEKRGKDGTDLQVYVSGFVEGEAVIIFADQSDAYEPPPWSAIGTGAASAEGILNWRLKNSTPDPFSSLSEVLYYVYEAKRFGETSPHVGPITEMIIVAPPRENSSQPCLQFVSPEHLAFLEREYKKFGPHPLPYEREQFLKFPDVF